MSVHPGPFSYPAFSRDQVRRESSLHRLAEIMEYPCGEPLTLPSACLWSAPSHPATINFLICLQTLARLQENHEEKLPCYQNLQHLKICHITAALLGTLCRVHLYVPDYSTTCTNPLSPYIMCIQESNSSS